MEVEIWDRPRIEDESLGALPSDLTFKKQLRGPLDVIVFFTDKRSELLARLPKLKAALAIANIATETDASRTRVTGRASRVQAAMPRLPGRIANCARRCTAYCRTRNREIRFRWTARPKRRRWIRSEPVLNRKRWARRLRY